MAQPNHYDFSGGANGQQQQLSGFPIGGLSRPPLQAGLTQAQTQHLNIAGRGPAMQMPGGGQNNGQAGAAHLQQMILAMQGQQAAQQQQHFQLQGTPQMNLQQQQMLQMQLQQQANAQAQANAQGPPTQSQGGPGGNMDALTKLLRSGQISAEQFQGLAHQFGQANSQRPGPQSTARAPVAPQPSAQFFTSLQQPAATDQAQERIPFAIIQPHMQRVHISRNLQTKVNSLSKSLASGIVGSSEQGMGGTPITPEQRSAIEKELADSRRQLNVTAQTIADFQNQWGQPKILSDWSHYNSANQTAQRRLQQQPLQPPALSFNNLGNPAAQSAAGGAMLQAQLMQAAQRGAATKLSMPQQRADQASLGLGGPPQMNAGVGPALSTAGQPNQMPPLHLLQTQLDPKVFMKSLFEVMRKRGEPITGTPYIDGREVDLYQLYQAVMLMGGSAKVQQNAMWPDVVKQLNWSSEADDAAKSAHLAVQLASTYQRLLYPFEEIWHKSLMKQHQQLLESRRKSGGAIPTTAAMAGMTPTQLLSFGFNASQVEFMRSQASTGASAGPAMGTAPIVTASPQTQANALAPGQFPAPPGTTLRPNTFEPSLEQISEARAIVSQLHSKMEGNRPKLKFLVMSEEEKARVAALTYELGPIVKKVHEILPLFLAMSNDTGSVTKILTMASLFDDQIKYIKTGQFALSMGGLEKLRDQFHRCWGFVKQNHKGVRPASTEPPPALSKDQFSMMVQKNAALRVEDLKPPPSKHRRTISTSAQSPPYPSPSPAFSGPQTPQTDVDSPPKSEAQARVVSKGKVPAAKPPRRKEAAKSVVPKIETKDASPLSAPPLLLEEEQLSLKRKRDQDDISLDPDAFIERTLRGLPRPLGDTFLAQDLTSHLPFDFDPVIPAVQDGAKPLSFSVLSSGDAFPPAPAAHARPPTPAFDFDFFIDSSAAGFDLTPPAATPELLPAKSEASPPSDEEDSAMGHAFAHSSVNLSLPAIFTPGIVEPPTQGGSAADEFAAYLKNSDYGLPPSFAWEGELEPRGVWRIHANE